MTALEIISHLQPPRSIYLSIEKVTKKNVNRLLFTTNKKIAVNLSVLFQKSVQMQVLENAAYDRYQVGTNQILNVIMICISFIFLPHNHLFLQ